MATTDPGPVEGGKSKDEGQTPIPPSALDPRPSTSDAIAALLAPFHKTPGDPSPPEGRGRERQRISNTLTRIAALCEEADWALHWHRLHPEDDETGAIAPLQQLRAEACKLFGIPSDEWISESVQKPPTFLSVIAWGFLLEETTPAAHEAYLVGKGLWVSVRGNHPKIGGVTHWKPMPEGPLLPVDKSP